MAAAISAGERGAAGGTDHGVPGAARRPGAARGVQQDSAPETSGLGRGALVLKVRHALIM